MAEPNRSRAEAWAAELDAARRRAGLTLPDRLAGPAEHLRRLIAQWALALVGIAVAYAARRSVVGFPFALGFATIASGFAVATVQTARVAHLVLAFPATATVSGFVEVREERARSDRITVRIDHIELTRRRSRRCVPVATISPAPCTSSASAPRAMRSARSRYWPRRSPAAPGCVTQQ